MATVSLRVPDDLKRRMEEHGEVNWSAVLRESIEDELAELESRRLAHAVGTSERLSGEIDPNEVEDRDSADLVREWRERRYGPESPR